MRRYAVRLAIATHTGIDYFLSLPVSQLMEIGQDIIDVLEEQTRKGQGGES